MNWCKIYINMKYILKQIFFLALLLNINIYAQEIVDETIGSQVSASSISQEAQLKIDNLDDESKEIYYEYKDTIAEYKSLKTYDDQLQQIINAQNDEVKSILQQIDSLDSTNKDILPFLKRMIDVLREFVLLDVPFLKKDRIQKIDELDSILLKANVTTAEKFRKVFETYQSEYNFGNTIETYSGTMEIDDSPMAVRYFRLGRIGYYYASLDYKKTGYWDDASKEWIHSRGKFSNELKAAIDIANRQAPPNFINLPIKPVDRSGKWINFTS